MPFRPESDKLQVVAEFIRDMTWDELPEEIRRQARRALLDTLGATIAGSATPVGRLMTAFARGNFGGQETEIPVQGGKASPAGSALAAGFMANALDIDDGYRLIKGHPGACILPVLLSAVQITPKTSGSDFLTALVIGYELCIRAGLIRHATYTTYHSSGSWGAVGGAAAGGRLLGMDIRYVLEAMGAAEYHAPIAPMMKGIARPAMVKDSIGWGTMVAMSSLLMANQGFTGVISLYAESPNPDWIQSLGHEFYITGLYFKPYAACRWGQPAVAAALNLAKAHSLAPDHIMKIRVRTFQEAKELPNAHPQSTEEAQYSLAFPVAAALLDGEVGPAQVLPPRISDPDVLDLMDRVQVEVDQVLSREFPVRALAEVKVHDRDGRVYESGLTEAPWEPATRLPTDQELVDKFMWLASPVLGRTRAAGVSDFVMTMDKRADASDLIRLCRKGG